MMCDIGVVTIATGASLAVISRRQHVATINDAAIYSALQVQLISLTRVCSPFSFHSSVRADSY
jgi:hypothetical protein